MAEKLLEGKTIVVTGTARGVGHKMTESFAAQGANVFALARTETEEHSSFCNKLSLQYGVEVIPVYFDMTDYDAMKEAASEIRTSGYPINGLVNNAGISPNLALMQMTPIGTVRETMEVNFFSPYIFTKFMAKLMIKNKAGSIVSIASIRGIDSYAGDSAYAASKAALIMMTKCLAEEVGSYGIRANVICPGLTETNMITQLHEENRNIELEATPLKKFGQVEDIANSATFLLSDLSSYITGQTIRIDGGVTSMRKRF